MGNTLCAIEKWDTRSQQKLDRLLMQEGIRRDRNLSYTCGIFDEEMRPVHAEIDRGGKTVLFLDVTEFA